MKLYKIDVVGSIRIWSINIIGDTLSIAHGMLNGKTTRAFEQIEKGLAGRTIEEQVELRLNSRVNEQLDRGYKRTINEAKDNVGTNGVGTFKPMLAQNIDKQKKYDPEGSVIQRKLDGNRLLVTKQEDRVVGYTRNGKIVSNLEHIIKDLGDMKEGQTLDGEVYIHGMALKDIGSLMRKKQEGTELLKYHVYDTIDDRPFKQRFNTLKDMFLGESIVLEHSYNYTSQEDVKQLFKNVTNEGYEGLIMRLDGVPYEVGKRSKGLLKIKYRQDAEGVVMDIEQAKNGAAILVIRVGVGKVCKMVVHGTLAMKRTVYLNKEKYIGRQVTYSYAYMTEYGIPFHAVAERWYNGH